MSRKLASIKSISKILPIEGKDRIVLAVVDGWQIIVQKEEYQIGDRTIFCEIDSVLPDKPEFEFLRKKQFRIKTMKMGGVLSQGICFPLSLLPQGNYDLDQDVTDLLEIKQYESTMDIEREDREPADTKFKHPFFTKFLFKYKLFRKLLLSNKQSKGFPDFISKTDETRIQNIPLMLENKMITYQVTEKIDGQSGTFFLQRLPKKYPWSKVKFDYGVCSRNLRIWNVNDESSYSWVSQKYKIELVLKQLIGDSKFVAIQGECVSPKVQGNKYKLSEPDLYAFNLIYPNDKIESVNGSQILGEFGIKWVPIISTDYILPDSVKEILDYATGKSELYDTLREGFVFRNYEKKISFKAVSPDFLIKNDE